MSLRLVQFIVPADKRPKALEIFQEFDVREFWFVDIGEERKMVSALMESEETEGLIDRFQAEFSGSDSYRTMIMEVLAFAPREEKGDEASPQGDEKEKKAGNGRISREELYAIMTDFAKPSRVFAVLMLFSVLVATIGIFEDNVSIVIGAAVINPLLRPNLALSLATNLADSKLARASIASLLLGIAIIVAVSFLMGLVLDINPYLEVITSRRQVSLGEIVLAAASGAAAALLLTMRSSASLVGIAVAVALLPPLAVFGLLMGSGNFVLALDPLLLFLTDWIAINLAGVFTFFVLGVRPSTWWEADQARRSTIIALSAWAALMTVMATLIIIAEYRPF